MADSKSIFLPYVRLGLAARSVTTDLESSSQHGSLAMPIKVAIGEGPDPLEINLTLRGPGDVYGIPSSQIIRTEPSSDATSFEANYFPFVEFARADFPWLFTPARANDQGRLRPWLSLIVIKSEDVKEYTIQSSGPAILQLTSDAQLPDLAESAYWAYVQVSGSFEASELQSILTNEPERIVSRLVCPRRLEASTSYRACVVPAFKSGCQAGLRQDVATPDSDGASLGNEFRD